MRTAFAAALMLMGSGVALAQDAGQQVVVVEPEPTVIVVDEQPETFGAVGDFTVNFGRPTTFDSMRLDVRESLRPPGSFGPGNPMGCSPSVPDC